MSALPIVIGQEQPVLRAKTKRVQKVTKEVLKLLKDMRDTVRKADGAGLAAPQVNSNLRVCLTLIGGRGEGKFVALINPQITWKDDETVLGEEGCLSLPNVWLEVPRHRSIVVRYLDEEGKEQERKLSDFDARVVQHEVDHLDGILITDYRERRRAAL